MAARKVPTILRKNMAILMWRVQKLNSPISKLSEKVKELWVWLIVYCHRHPELPTNNVILWEPKHGRQNSGRPAKSLLCILMEDTKLESQEGLASPLADQKVWRVRHRACLKCRGFESVEAGWWQGWNRRSSCIKTKEGRNSVGLTFSPVKLFTFKPNDSSYVWF